MKLQASANDLVFQNKYGQVIILPEPDLAEWAELQAEADDQADAPERFVTGMKFAFTFSLVFWMIGIFCYLRFR